ncbi:hypothetical protein BH20CHL7_BH20CHL7_12320 [soil metagenome]
MPRDWDAGTYDRVADPMTRWGTAVLDRLPLRGAERVLDAGCGSGRVTERLLERLPDGHVVALDGSPAMVQAARQRLARFGDRGFVDVECWLTDEPTRLDPGEPFETYLRTVVLGAHLERLAPDEHDAFVRAVADGSASR